jgi:multidrug efflux pump subunit AcrA (membrane-fusion protein)
VFTGKVLFVSDVVESDTRRNKVRIAFDNPDRILKPNMFADASFVPPSVSRTIVPTSALLMTNDKTSVFVEVGLSSAAMSRSLIRRAPLLRSRAEFGPTSGWW